MDPGILKKLDKNEKNKDYGYDQKADIWGLGTICYEMLIGKSTFDSESMKELLNKVERGNYFLPSNLSKEVVSFLNGMIQYEPKKRLNAEQLLNHRFLKRPYSELTKINLKEAQNKIVGSKIKINSKNNQSIWEIFEQDEDSELDNISSDMIEKDEENNDNSKGKTNDTLCSSKNDGPDNIEIIRFKNKIIDEKEINEQFSEAFDFMNNDFIYIEPQLIPFVPGEDPLLLNEVFQSSENSF